MEQRFPFLHSLQDISLERGKSRSFLIFLALSFLFWTITKFSNQYTEVLTFDVAFENFPLGVVPISSNTSEVQVTLSASGFQFLFYKFFVNEIVLDSDKGTFEGGIASMSLEQSIKDIQDQLIGVTEVRALFPNTVNFQYSQLDNKRIPVKLQSVLNVVSGFGISEQLVFEPDSINVIGTSNILDTLKAVYINSDQISEVKKSFKEQLILYNPIPDQIKFSESSVSLKVVIDRFSEKSIEIPISLINVPDSIALKLFPSNIKLTFAASLTNIKVINESSFIISCDYNSLKLGDENLKLKLIRYPNNLQNLRWSPKQVEYLIRK